MKGTATSLIRVFHVLVITHLIFKVFTPTLESYEGIIIELVTTKLDILIFVLS